MKIEDYFYVEGKGDILVVYVEDFDKKLNIGDTIVFNNEKRIISEIECARTGIFDDRPKRLGLILKKNKDINCENKSFHSATPLGKNNTKSDSWATPQWIIDKLGGPFDLDPCQFLVNGKTVTHTANKYYCESDNGLLLPWAGNVFCNPPYSDLYTWLKKMSDYNNGIVLCFARTETKAIQDNIKNAIGINLIKKRIKFLDSNGIEKGNGNAPSMLIAWGEDNYKRIKNIEGVYCKIDN